MNSQSMLTAVISGKICIDTFGTKYKFTQGMGLQCKTTEFRSWRKISVKWARESQSDFSVFQDVQMVNLEDLG